MLDFTFNCKQSVDSSFNVFLYNHDMRRIRGLALSGYYVSSCVREPVWLGLSFGNIGSMHMANIRAVGGPIAYYQAGSLVLVCGYNINLEVALRACSKQ